MMAESRYYQLVPGVDVVPLADEAVLLRSSTLAIKLEGGSAALLAGRVLPLLRQARCFEDLVSELPEIAPEELRQALDSLTEARVLDRLASPPSKAYRDPHASFYRNLGIDSPSAQERLRAATVAIFGLEAHGAHLALDLARLGVGACILADPFLIEDADSTLMPRGAVVPGVARQEAVAKAIADLAPSMRVTVAGPLSREAVRNLAEGASAVVGCFDRGYETAQHWVNRAAMAVRVPALFAEISTHVAVVGPAVLPGQSACYMCYRMRRVACEENYDEAMAYEHFLNAAQHPTLSSRATAPSLPTYVSSLLTGEILKLLVLGLPTSLAGRVMEFDVLTLETRFHSILMQPHCPVCTDEKKKGSVRVNPDLGDLRKAVGQDPSGDLRWLASSLVSARTGIVKHFEPFVKDAVEPATPYIVRADVANHLFVSRHEDDGDICSGKGMTLEDARVSALGEAVERYSGAVHSPSEVLYARRSELSCESIDPRALVLYDPSQYADLPYAPYDDNRLGWVAARSLVTGREVLVPALAVFMNYHAHADGEFIAPITSNGLATGRTLLDAVWNASAEVLERDAFMIAWLNRLPARRVATRTHPDPDVSNLTNLYSRRGVEIRLYLMPSDHHVAVFAAVALEWPSRGGPAAVFGLGVDSDPTRASRKAVLEVCQVRPALRRRLRRPDTADRLRELLEEPQRVSSINDHDLLYASSQSLARLGFWLDADEQPFEWSCIPSESRSDDLTRLVQWLRASSRDLLYVNLTPPDMAPLGLYTVRAILPGFQPIDFGWKERRLGGRRIHEVPVALGSRLHEGGIDALNPDPHPLA